MDNQLYIKWLGKQKSGKAHVILVVPVAMLLCKAFSYHIVSVTETMFGEHDFCQLIEK